MAQLTNQKNLSGLVGNVVFQNQNGRQVLRSRPTKVRQTTATKKSAKEFCLCSSWAKQLRKGLTQFLVGLTDNTMHQRFTSTVYGAIQQNTVFPKGERTSLNSDMGSLAGFEFNSHSLFTDYCRMPITTALDAMNQLTITIPGCTTASQVSYPEGCTNAELVVYITAHDFSPASPTAMQHFILPLSKSEAGQPETVWTSGPLPTGCLVLVTAKLLYYEANPFTGRNYLNHKELNPSMVVMAGNVAV